MSGGTKFPTDDSKALANSLLRSGQQEAIKMKNPSGPSLRDITPHTTHSRAGSLPKMATANVGEYDSDPLVQYLKKQDKQEPSDGRTMGKEWPDGLRGRSDNQLEDNFDNHPSDNHWGARLTSEDPGPTEHQHKNSTGDWREKVQTIFDNRTPPRDKCHDKDHEPTVGEVDAILKKFA